MTHQMPTETTQPAESIKDYLNTALDLIESDAVRSVSVDWTTVRAEAHRLAANATTTAETYSAIEFALSALQDRHSFLQRPAQPHGTSPGGFGIKYVQGVIARVYPDSPADHAGLQVGDRVLAINDRPVGPGVNEEMPRAGDISITYQSRNAPDVQHLHLRRAPFGMNRMPQGRLVRPDVAWIDLPDHGGDGTLPDDQLYQDAVQKIITELYSAGARKWIVDLRLNEGGNMYPMLAGIGPLTGEGPLGAFVRDGETWSWGYQDGAVSVDGQVNSRITGQPHPPLDADIPVAVLLSPLTSSSGEIVALSFQGRPATRFFGEPTQGLTSANGPYPLPDGATIWLATCYEADRTGQVYTAEVHPDLLVHTEWGDYLTPEDEVMNAAQAWLSSY
ncbi:S41 family peptidase [Deinococcus sp.]|uniref:S41 family peptidase n=1 Tax=Deinococcus sp. TaxID=47478 RepID=UPI0025B990F4|nr:S41 family peptidase [Deinococcus sp.]